MDAILPYKMWVIFICTLFFSITAQSQTIHGFVHDDTGEILPGASIVIDGTTVGTISDAAGAFEIEAEEGRTLVISFLGYQTQKITIGSSRDLVIVMQSDAGMMDEVVVVGYGEQKRSNLTGAVTSVRTDQLENRPVLRLDQALQGMSSGVMVSKGGGTPGGSPTIHIRGIGSISNTDPLWIVDGIKMNPGNHFNLDDVASIEILKDAAASAIYGAEAAHGVILVTTKQGVKGQTQINWKSSFAATQPINLPSLLGSEDFVRYKKESRLNAGQNPEPAWDQWEYDTDWIDAFYDGQGIAQYHDLSIAKGFDRSNIYFSLGYDDEKGIVIDNDFKRMSLRLNSDFELTKWLTVGERMLLSRVGENPVDNFNENYNGAIPYRSIPIMPIYDEDNPFGGWGRGPVYFQGPNPVATQYQQHEKKRYNRMDGNVYARLNPLAGLTIQSRVGYNTMSFLGQAFFESFDYGAFANPINALTMSNAQDETITANVVATYERSIGDHHVSVMLGYESSRFETIHFNAVANDFPVSYATSFNLARGSINITDRQTVFKSRLLSQFGRLTYNFREKYLFEANVRRDASAPVFSPQNIWGIFPSFSAGWRITEEPFAQDLGSISNIKLRASIGTLGSDNIGNFIYSKTYTSQFSSYTFDATGQNKQVGFYISRFPNADVKWEEIEMKNIGLDMELWKGKVAFSLDYYIKDTRDLLYGVPIPASVGIATHNFDPVNPEINIGRMRNSGIDLDIMSRHTFGDLKLIVNANASYMKNKVLELNEDEYITSGSGGGQIGGMTRTQAGMPISSFYGFVVQQMLNSSSDVFAINSYAADGIYQEAGTAPGDLMYRDISGPDGVPDGKITWEHDRTFIGNPWPKFSYGLNVNLAYKNSVDLLLQFQGIQDVDIFNANKAYAQNFYGDNNTTTDIFGAWTPENHTQIPRNIASDPNGNFSRPSTYFIEDGSYFKLRNIQLGYNLPASILGTLGGIQSVRLYINANNIFTLTGYSGADPEMAGGNISRGIDYGLYPHTRTIGGGIDIHF